MAPDTDIRSMVRNLQNQGIYFVEEEDYQSARLTLISALELEPDNTETLFLLAQTERILGETYSAIARCDRILELEPDWREVRFFLSELLVEGRRFIRASVLLTDILEKEPHVLTAYGNLSFTYISIGFLSRTYRMLLNLVNQFPEDLSLNYYLGLYFAQWGEKKEAKKLFEKTLTEAIEKLKKIQLKKNRKKRHLPDENSNDNGDNGEEPHNRNAEEKDRENLLLLERNCQKQLLKLELGDDPEDWKSRLFRDFGTVVLGSMGDDGMTVSYHYYNSSFADMYHTLHRFMVFRKLLGWKIFSVVAVDFESEPLAMLFSLLLEIPFKKIEEVFANEWILAVDVLSVKEDEKYIEDLMDKIYRKTENVIIYSHIQSFYPEKKEYAPAIVGVLLPCNAILPWMKADRRMIRIPSCSIIQGGDKKEEEEILSPGDLALRMADEYKRYVFYENMEPQLSYYIKYSNHIRREIRPSRENPPDLSRFKKISDYSSPDVPRIHTLQSQVEETLFQVMKRPDAGEKYIESLMSVFRDYPSLRDRLHSLYDRGTDLRYFKYIIGIFEEEEDPCEKARLYRFILDWQDPRLTAFIKECLKGEDRGILRSALTTPNNIISLAKIRHDQNFYGVIHNLLEKEDEGIILSLLQSIRINRFSGFAPALVQLAEHPSLEIRLHSLKTLWELGLGLSREKVVDLIESPHEDLQSYGFLLLERLRDPCDVHFILSKFERLKEKPKTSALFTLRTLDKNCFLNFAEKQMQMGKLEKTLKMILDFPYREPDPDTAFMIARHYRHFSQMEELRRSMLFFLLSHGDSRVAGVVRELLKPWDYRQKEVLNFFEKYPSEWMADRLIPFMDYSVALQYRISALLLLMGRPDFEEVLGDGLLCKSPQRNYHAALAYARIGSYTAFEKLVKFLKRGGDIQIVAEAFANFSSWMNLKEYYRQLKEQSPEDAQGIINSLISYFYENPCRSHDTLAALSIIEMPGFLQLTDKVLREESFVHQISITKFIREFYPTDSGILQVLEGLSKTRYIDVYLNLMDIFALGEPQ